MRASDYDYFRPPFAAMAHRGGSTMPGNVGRENTIAAFRAAVDLGFAYLETDVHATRDGHVVAFHDETLDRVTDGTGAIADLSLAELSTVRVGGEPIPTLDELLDTFPGVRINIDIKASAATRPLVDVLAKHAAEARVCVGSFCSTRLWQFRRLTGSRVATAASPIGVGAAALAPWKIGVVRSPAPVWQMPISHRAAGQQWRLLSRSLVANLHRAGKKIHIWTVDDPTTMHELIDLGVDGIVTDRPDVLAEVMAERGIRQP